MSVVLQHIGDGVTVQDTAGRLVYANDAAAHASGYPSADAMLAHDTSRTLAAFEMRDDEGRPFDLEALPGRVTLRTGEPARATIHTRDLRDGDERTWDVQSFPEFGPDGRLRHAVNIARDITRERHTAEQLRLRARRQFRIAELGRKALAGMDIQQLMEEIPAIVALKLTVPYAAVLQHRAERGDLVVRAASGWREDLVGYAVSDAPDASLSAYALESNTPIEAEDLQSDPRFGCPAILTEHGVVSAASAPIRHLGHPFGAIGAYSTRKRVFTEDDLYFLESVANILAAAIERREAEDVVRESEKRLTMAMEAGRLGTWDWNVVTGVVHWSDGIEEMHGLPPGSFGGTFESFQSDMHPDDRAAVLEAIRRVLEEGGDYHVQYRILPPDGSIRWIEGKGMPVLENGRPVRLIGTCMDISERKRFEEERARLYELARVAEQRSAFLAEASNVLAATLDYETTLTNVAKLVTPDLADWCLIHLLDRDGKLRLTTIAHEDSDKAAWGRQLEDRFPHEPDEAFGLWEVLRTGQPELVPEMTDAILRSVARTGNHFSLLRSIGIRSAMVVPMGAAERQVGCITFLRAENPRPYTEADLTLAADLAGRCAAAIENARLYREVQWADRAKDEFLAMLSHELRNPLGAVANGLHMLEAVGSQSEEARRHRAMLGRQVENMTRLLNDLLDVSRSTRGRVQLQRVNLDLRSVIEDALEAMRPALEARQHHVATALPDTLLPVFADRTRLEQVFSNLLGNAAKYTDPGGQIRISATADSGSVVVRVEDNGIGIAPQLLPHVFDLFTQADRSLDRSQGGLGIGLTLVKSLVELHGGAVAAHSDGPGRGCTFTVSLPLSTEAPPATEHVSDSPVASPVAPRVLVVEDNEDAAETITAILEIWGCTVQAVHHGLAALEAAATFRPDVVLLDIGLPGMDGYEVARRLRRIPETANACLLAVTGYGRAEDRQAACEAGFQHCLSKPVDMDALKCLIFAGEE